MIELLYPGNALWSEWDFWRYFLLALQEDPLDDSSDCASTFTEFEALYKNVYAKTSDRTDYDQGV